MTERELILKIRKIDKLLAEKRERDELSRYNTGDKIHFKQLDFHKCKKRIRWVFGGNRTGKTECGAVEVVWMARGIHPYRENRKNTEGWVVSLSRDVQREVAQRKILKYLSEEWIEDIVMNSGRADCPETGVIDCITVRNVFGGLSRIWFKSCEMGRAKFQGASLDYVWFDEEPPEDIFDECMMRVVDKKGDIFATMTPLLGRTFVYDRIYLNPGHDDRVWYEFMSWKDNPFLDEEELASIRASLSEEELNMREHGRFSSLKGLVYSEFDENVHVIDPFSVPPDWQNSLSIDPGLNNPLSCHWYAVDYDGNVYAVAEHFAAGKDVGWHAEEISRISDEIGWHRGSDGRIYSLIDSAANQKTLAYPKSVTELFCEHGIFVNPRVDKDLFTGIARVKEYFKKNKLFVFRGCVNLIRELKGYRWGAGDVPTKRDDHCLDELRYFVMSRPRTDAPKGTKSDVAKEKERLARKLSRRYARG